MRVNSTFFIWVVWCQLAHVSSIGNDDDGVFTQDKVKLIDAIVATSYAASAAASSPVHNKDRKGWLISAFQEAAKCLKDDIVKGEDSSLSLSQDAVRMLDEVIHQSSSSSLAGLIDFDMLSHSQTSLDILYNSLLNSFDINLIDNNSEQRKTMNISEREHNPRTNNHHEPYARFGKGGSIPALVHQMWKSDLAKDLIPIHSSSSSENEDKLKHKINGEEEFNYDLFNVMKTKRFFDSWDDTSWRHLIWTDKQLSALIENLAPWLSRTIQLMPKTKIIRRIDTMRYALVLMFGGVYIDADNQRWSGDLHGLFNDVPPRGIACGVDPHVFASTPKHPLLVQMLLYIILRTDDGTKHCSLYSDGSSSGSDRVKKTSSSTTDQAHEKEKKGTSDADDEAVFCVDSEAWGRNHELTGPAAWRRVLESYQRCQLRGLGGNAASKEYPLHHASPLKLFNQGHCGCWGGHPESGTVLLDPRLEKEVVKMKPAGRKIGSPRVGSDLRVSLYRQCPQDRKCRAEGCHNHNSGEAALGGFGYPGGGASVNLTKSTNAAKDVLKHCEQPPSDLMWCVGVHGCSATYARPSFSGGKGLTMHPNHHTNS